jgi:hypothetical protein
MAKSLSFFQAPPRLIFRDFTAPRYRVRSAHDPRGGLTASFLQIALGEGYSQSVVLTKCLAPNMQLTSEGLNNAEKIEYYSD